LKDAEPDLASEDTKPKHKPSLQALIESQSDCV
jgi:hypothetical protein